MGSKKDKKNMKKIPTPGQATLVVEDSLSDYTDICSIRADFIDHLKGRQIEGFKDLALSGEHMHRFYKKDTDRVQLAITYAIRYLEL